MADSSVHSLASLHSFGSSTFGSRPSSRAQSDASFVTARPGTASSTRSISHDIDHIKTLISRSAAAEAPSKQTGSITAQVFRQRSTSSPNVTQAHIYHELDQLKRRIRQEQQQQQQIHQLTRRISQIDPGQESDSDHEEVPDEREVELERAREDVIVVRQRLDGLLERAELRIDRLTAEKEKLEGTCEQNRDRLEITTAKCKNLTQALDVAQTSIERLESEMTDAHKVAQGTQEQLSDLRGEKLKTDATHERQVAALQLRNTELEASLAAAKQESRKTSEKLDKLSEERAKSDKVSKENTTRLQEQLDVAVTDSERQKAEIQELRSSLADAEAASSQINSENVEQRGQLEAEIAQSKSALQQALQDVATSTAEHQEVVESRDKLTAEVERYRTNLAAALDQQQRTENELVDLRKTHEEQDGITSAQIHDHEKVIADLQESAVAKEAQLKERDQSHGLAIEELATQHEQALGDLKGSHRSEIGNIRLEAIAKVNETEEGFAKKLEEMENQYKQTVEELKASHQSETKEVHRVATAKVNETEQSYAKKFEEAVTQHRRALEDLQASHQSELEDHCVKATKEARDVQEHHAKTLQRLATQHEQSLVDLNASHRSEVDQTRSETMAKVQDLGEEGAKKIAELTTQHEQALDSIKTSHQSEVEQARLEKIEHARALNEDHAGKLTELRSQYQESLGQAVSERERISDELTVLKAQHDELIRKLQQDHQESIQEAAKRMEELNLNNAQHLERINSEHVAALSKANNEAEKLRHEALEQANKDADRRLQELQESHASELQRLASERDASVEATRQQDLARYENMIDTLRQEESERYSKLSNAHVEEIAVLKARLMELQSEHSSVLETVRKDHEAAVREISDKHASEDKASQGEAHARADGLRASHDAALAEMQIKHNQATEKLRLDHSDIVGAAEQRYFALKTAHEAELAARGDQHEQTVLQLRGDHTSEVAALHSEHEIQLQEKQDSFNAALRQNIAELQEKHQADLTSEQTRSHKALAEAAAMHQKALESATADNQSAVSKLQADLSSTQRELESLKAQTTEEKSQIESDYQRKIGKLEVGWSQMAEDATKAHRADLQNAADEATRDLNAATQAFQQQLNERETAEASRVAEFQNAHARETTCIRENAKTDVESAQAELQATKERMLAEHGNAITQLQSGFNTRFEELQLEHTAGLAALREKLEAAELKMKTTADENERFTTELRSTHVAELQRLTTKHDQERDELQSKSRAEMELLRKDSVEVLSRVSAIEADYGAQIEDLKLNHDTEITVLKNEVAAYVEAIKTKTREAEDLQTRMEDVELEAEDRAATTEKQHKAALDAAVERTRQSGQAELRNLKKRHQDAVSQVRATAQKQAAAQFSDLEKMHQKELEQCTASHQEEILMLKRSTSEAHQGEIMRLETEHHTNLAELESRLQDERRAEIESKQGAYDSGVTALQTRLDAALTGQAEAERAVALLRQQVVKTDRRSLESKASAEDQVATLQRENEDLSKQLTLVQSSLRDLQQKGGSGTNTPTRAASPGEVASLRLQLDNIEEERVAMRRALEKKSTERLELTRQNDFLVKELEVLLAQRTRTKKPTGQMVDALVQTDPFISEPKVDLATVQLLKSQARNSMRPSTPLSPGQRQAKDEIEMAWNTRSFEDYLDNARSELSQLGSVISANENLFAKKISEHVSELQRAKDQLAADYDARIESLAADKDMMEAMVLTKQQAAFAKDRKELVARYSAGSLNSDQDPTGRHAVPLRSAEERLVADYNKRIFRRKSQIALKHAEEFQKLTREYDRKVADLLDNRSELEGDLSIDPVTFEQDMNQMQTRSARLAERSSKIHRNDRASPSPMPSEDGLKPRPLRRRSPTSPAEGDRSRQLTRTSTPRTSLSIPRSSSVPRGPIITDENGTPTSQPRKEKHPPVPQLSLLRIKTPSDVYVASPRAVSSPLASSSPVKPPMSPRLRRASQQISPQPPPRLSSRGKGDIAQDLSIEPLQFERQQFQRQSSYVKGAAKPNMLEPSKPGFLRRVVDRISSDTSKRVSSEASRPGSSSSKTMPTASSSTPSSSSKFGHRARSKSTKLSSGMIYYQAPKQSPPFQSYDL